MFKRIAILMILAAMLVAGTVSVSAQDTPPQNTITVTGVGQASSAPDLAFVRMGVETINEDVAAAFSQTNETMTAVIDALKALGIDDADIQTQGLYLYQESPFEPDRETQVRFRAGNNVRVTVRDITRVGEVIEAGVGAGANSVSNLSFGLDDPFALESEARAAAVEDARSRAEALAELAGVTLGDPIIITELSMNETPFPANARVAAMAEAGVPIEQGQLNVTVQVRVTYSIGG